MIMYHGIRHEHDDNPWATPVGRFREQVQYIKKHFVPLTVSDLLRQIDSDGSYPKNSVVITIDDAYENFVHIALPVLQELNVPATVFVVAGLVEESSWIWTDKVIYLLRTRDSSSGRPGQPETEDVLAKLKSLPTKERNQQIDSMAQELRIPIPVETPARYRLMSWDQCRAVQKTGLVQLGSHTLTHPIMSHLSDEESQQEIYRSKSLLQERLDTEITTFSYPNGQRHDFRQNQQSMIHEAGYECALAAHFGYIVESANRYALPRLNYGGSDLSIFAKYLDGVEYLQKKSRYRSE